MTTESGTELPVPQWLSTIWRWVPSLVVFAAFAVAATLRVGADRTTGWWAASAVVLAVAYTLRGSASLLGLALSLAVVAATQLPGVSVVDPTFDAFYLLVLLLPILPLVVVASEIDARWSWLALVITATVTAVISPNPPWSSASSSAQETVARYVLDLGVPAIAATAAWLAGYAIRSRQHFADATWQRALSLERAREAETANAISQERNQIARDLHDVVTHSVAVMVVQAAAADAVWDRDREQARLAIRAVEQSGRSVMGELRDMLGAMRTDDASAGARRAQPGLNNLRALVERIESAGLDAQLRTSGDLERVAPATALSLLRITQESVTNALRHAGASSILIEVTVGDENARVTVDDDGVGIKAAQRVGDPLDPDRAGGHGLIGMRERAAALNGSFEIAERPEGGTRISVEAPLPRRALT